MQFQIYLKYYLILSITLTSNCPYNITQYLFIYVTNTKIKTAKLRLGTAAEEYKLNATSKTIV